MKNTSLTPEQIEKRNQYLREWRMKNKDKEKKYYQSLSPEQKKKRQDYVTEWRRRNKDKVSDYNKKAKENLIEKLVQERVEQEVEKRLAEMKGDEQP